MRNQSSVFLKTLLIFSDALSIALAFTCAYIYRVKILDKPIFLETSALNFIYGIFLFIPFWVILLGAIGLYSHRIFKKQHEMPRLIIGSTLGVSLMISWSYLFDQSLFPAKLIALSSIALVFIFLYTNRAIAKFVYGLALKHGHFHQRTVVIGKTEDANAISKYLKNFPREGYTIVCVVGNSSLAKSLGVKNYTSLEKALNNTEKLNTIIDTIGEHREKHYRLSMMHNAHYIYTTNHSITENTLSLIDLVGDIPIVTIQATPLTGLSIVFKRCIDIIVALLSLIISFPLWIMIIILQKIYEPYSPAFFKQERYSKYSKVVAVYKFRSMKQEFSGMTPEEAFTKMGRQDLIKPYYENGQYIDNDPRITKIGAFLRATSLDELPQLINILKGDISLVGPRALPMNELDNRQDKDIILSVKSGLTGLAQVSGRRDISFEERRKLDVYYVQNWSLGLDFEIIFKTVLHVLLKKGAR